MAEQRKNPLASRELQGIALFTLSIFPLILVVLALVKPSGPDAGGTARIANAIVEMVGYFPAILCAGGFATVGGMLLMSRDEVDMGRHLSGFVFASIGLAVCLGALSDVHGGAFGRNTGGALREPIGSWAGLLVGGAVACVSIWLAWMGGTLDFSRNSGQGATLSDALSEKDGDGVSEAEANALVPDEDTLAYMEQVWSRASDPAPQVVPLPASPYPEDVRLEGKVPEGAAPLPTTDESTEPERPTAAPAAQWRPAQGPDGADVGAGTDLAPAPDPRRASPGAGGDDSGQDDPFVQGSPDAVEDELTTATAGAVAGAPSVPIPLDPTVPAGARRLDVDTSHSAGPPLPSWEQPPLFEGEKLAEQEEDLEGEELEEDELDAELDEEGEYEEEEEDEEYEEEDDEEEAAEYEEEEEGDEEEDEEYEDEEYELEEGEEEEGEEEEEDEEEDELAAEYEEEEEDDESEEELAEGDLEEEASDEPQQEAGEDAESEPAAVLTPQPAPKSAAKTPPMTPEELVQQSGALFLEQGRVAVSLLQRRFALDFDRACEVLDELQEQGLIGPYMGGQRRDILMTLEEWQGRVASS